MTISTFRRARCASGPTAAQAPITACAPSWRRPAQEDFPRIRVGVGQRGLGWNLADWVLSHYQTAEEQEIADRAYEQAADAALEYLKNGINSAMNRYNTKKPKKEKSTKKAAPEGDDAAASEQAEEGKE